MAVNVVLTRKFFDADLQFIKNGVKEGANIIIPEAFTEDDLMKYSPDADIFFGPVISKRLCETTVGTSNFMGLEKYMVQEGMVYNFVKGDLEPKRNAFDAAYTAALIYTVYKFRGLGDGTAYINSETERLLSSYISLYLQISFDARDQISKLRYERPFTAEKKAAVDSLALMASKYLELGIKQFPKEWRCYWAAAFVFEAAGMKQEALNVLGQGIKAVPEFEEGGRARLVTSLQQISEMPDGPLTVETPESQEETPVQEDSLVEGGDGAPTDSQPAESGDSTPTVALAN